MGNISKYEEYLVQISFEYKIDEKMEAHFGSGVVIKPFDSSKYLYIFTAKHTFEKEIRDEEYPDDKQMVLFDDKDIKKNITIDKYPKFAQNITKIIQLEDKDLDLLILEVCIEKLDLEITALNIYRNEVDEVMVAGFPSIRDGLPYGYNSSFERYYDDLNKIHIEFKSQEDLSTKSSDEFNAIKGISGGGVFVENNNEIYLYGIEIEYQKPRSFKCIKLAVMYREINTILKSRTKILLVPIDLDNGESFDMEMVKVDLEDKSLYVSIHPVSFKEYALYMKYKNKDYKQWYGKNEKPVTNISYKNAKKYCKWLSNVNEIKDFKLLSSTDWLKIAELNRIDENTDEGIWYNKKKTASLGTTEVGKLKIHDMYGNVEEWCSDEVSIGGSFRDSTLNRTKEKKERNKTDEFDFLGFRIAFQNEKDNIRMSNTANGQQKLLKLLTTSNELFKRLQEVEKLKVKSDLISPENMEEAEKLIRGLGSRKLLILVKEMEKLIYENKG